MTSTTSSATTTAVRVTDDDVTTRSHPQAGGPQRRRSFTPAEKLAHLDGHEQACQDGHGGAYLRREGLYSSQITEWRKLRDSGTWTTQPGPAKPGRLSPEQVEIARLKAQLNKAERRLARTEVALEIMGKGHALLEAISESAPDEQPPTSH